MNNLVAIFTTVKQIEYPFLSAGDLIVLVDKTSSSDFGWYAKSNEEVKYCNVLVINEDIEIIGEL